MARLTKKQIASIEYALRNAERTYRYLHADDLVLTRTQTAPTTTLHYERADGHCLFPVAKHSSDIVGLENTILTLRDVLAMHGGPLHADRTDL